MEPGLLHWSRPLWLWALLLLPLWGWLAVRRARQPGVWTTLVDAHLLPHLLATTAPPGRRLGRWSAAAAYVLAVLALAGPGWRQVEQPLWKEQAPLVVALDLSSAIGRRDLPPSRLAQARAKLAALLQGRQGGQVGLVAYAGDAFTVAPLTGDGANVALFLDALAPDVMPVDGQRIDRALAWSGKLLRQAGFTQGDILVMGDHATGADIAAATAAASAGFRVSVLGVGARAGFDEASLRQLASAGGGRYQRITMDDADLRALGVLAPNGTSGLETASAGRHWQDQGYWLLPLVMLLVLPLFRRGVTVMVLVLAVGWPLGAAQAAEWWQRPDQARHAAMEAAVQRYRAGDYEGAAQGFAQVDSADAHYNRGNALAKAGRYAEAIRAYDQALQRAPGMVDAEANRRAVQAALQHKPPQGGGQGASASRKEDANPAPSSRPSTGGGQGQGAGASPAPAGGQRGAGADASPAEGQPDERGAAGDHQAPGTRDTQRSPGDSRGPSNASADTAQPGAGVAPADTGRQARADAAQRARMREATAGDGNRDGVPARPASGNRTRVETPAERERRMANEAWLRRVPDDPGGLLREKFRLEYQRRLQQGASSQ